MLYHLHSLPQTRYERVSGESDDRMQQFNTSVDELAKFDSEFASFESWLRAAERTLDSYLMDVARDRDGLQKQVSKLQPFNEDVVSHSADLRFINMSGKRFLEETKVRIVGFGETLHFKMFVDRCDNIRQNGVGNL